MSNDREFDMAVDELLDISQRNAAKWPADPGWTDEFWQGLTRRIARRIYRLGSRAQLGHSQRKQVDPVERLRWLSEQAFGDDLRALIYEVETAREQANAIKGAPGVTGSDIHSMLAEGFHTAFRKATDSMESAIAWKAIRDMEDGEYSAIIDFVAEPLIAMLRRAEAEAGAPGEGTTP
jgi:hypothetical protein